MDNLLFGYDLRERQEALVKSIEAERLILKEHKDSISQSYKLQGSLSLTSAIQLLFFYSLTDEDDLNEFTEEDILRNYIHTLMAIQNDLSKAKGTIKIDLARYSEIGADFILEKLKNYNYGVNKNLTEWKKFLEDFSEYRINARCIRKFAEKKKFKVHINPNLEPMTKRECAKKARLLILKIIKADDIEKLREINKSSQGKKGLKSYIRKKIDPSDFTNLFDSKEKTFTNRWINILPEVNEYLKTN